MAYVSPSILAADFGNMARDVEDICRSGADMVHVDVMDGEFVPNISLGFPTVRAVKKASTLPLDVHLMIVRPLRYVEEFIKAGADWLTVHVESDTPENILCAIQKIRSLGCHPGISVKPGTPAQALEPYLPLVDLVLVMTVEPGFGGQKFMADMMAKLRTLRALLDECNPGCLIQVDGGVDKSTAPLCIENGAQVLVAGSAYFKAGDRSSFVKALQG